jgi:glyoxylase-like metal-dependent hydrolase (beta-lactamase superfamily II)
MPSRYGALLVETIVNGPFVENCYLVMDEESRQALLVDPGDEDERILETVRGLGATVKEIVCTHAHIDHAGAVAPLSRLLGAPFALHAAERPWLERMPSQAAVFGLDPREVPRVDRELVDGETIALGGQEAKVLFTPGHSAGGCCLSFAGPPPVVLVGDTLFQGSIGRTDLPGGSLRALLASIRERLFTLPDATVVLSGHGPATTIGEEKRSNPFLRPGALVDD